VKPTLQLDHPDYDHIFAIGDVAHTTAIKAGHVGYWQAGVAVENIVKLLEGEEQSKLKVYEPTKPMIKVTVGKVRAGLLVLFSEYLSLDIAQGRGTDVGRRWESKGDGNRGHARGSRGAEHVELRGRKDG
jgi:NADPH-dependent 2,4-dienoyl-CoA reductase/sulfur reductase-like enzyme